MSPGTSLGRLRRDAAPDQSEQRGCGTSLVVGGSGMLLGVDTDPLEFVCAAAAKPHAEEGAAGPMPAAAGGTWDQCRQ